MPRSQTRADRLNAKMNTSSNQSWRLLLGYSVIVIFVIMFKEPPIAKLIPLHPFAASMRSFRWYNKLTAQNITHEEI